MSDLERENADLRARLADVTERERSDAVLAEHHLFQAVFEQTAEAVLILDPDGRVREANRVARRLRGEAPLGRHFDEAFPLQDESGNALPAARLLLAGAGGVEVRLVHLDRSHRLIFRSGRLLGDEGELLAHVVTLADVTRIAELTDELARKVIEELGGSLGFESVEGEGATFRVRLPAMPAEMGGGGGPLSGSAPP